MAKVYYCVERSMKAFNCRWLHHKFNLEKVRFSSCSIGENFITNQNSWSIIYWTQLWLNRWRTELRLELNPHFKIRIFRFSCPTSFAHHSIRMEESSTNLEVLASSSTLNNLPLLRLLYVDIINNSKFKLIRQILSETVIAKRVMQQFY